MTNPTSQLLAQPYAPYLAHFEHQLRIVSRAVQCSSNKQEFCAGFGFGGHLDGGLCRRLWQHSVLFVQGEPGCGKTSTLPLLTYLWARERLSSSSARVVIALPMRKLVEEAAQKLQSDLQGDGKAALVGWVHGKDGWNVGDPLLCAPRSTGWLAARSSDSR